MQTLGVSYISTKSFIVKLRQITWERKENQILTKGNCSNAPWLFLTVCELLAEKDQMVISSRRLSRNVQDFSMKSQNNGPPDGRSYMTYRLDVPPNSDANDRRLKSWRLAIYSVDTSRFIHVDVRDVWQIICFIFHFIPFQVLATFENLIDEQYIIDWLTEWLYSQILLASCGGLCAFKEQRIFSLCQCFREDYC